MTVDTEAPARPTLRRVLSELDAVVLGFGAMIGWGWIILAGAWVSGAGLAGAGVAFLVGSTAIAVIGLTYAELASALPFAGGEHAYAARAFGPGAAFVATWAIIFGYVSVVAFEAIALPVAIVYLFPALKFTPLWTIAGYSVHLSEVVIGGVGAILITILNIIGIRVAARVQAVVVILLLIAGAVLAAGGIVKGPANIGAAPIWLGAAGMFSVIVTVPFLFVGFDVIPQSAEEISPTAKEAGNMGNVGRSLVGALLAAMAFYIIIVFAVGLAPAWPGASGLATPDAAGAYWGSAAAAFVVFAGIGGILTSWNAFLIGGSRALFALARSGQLPPVFARVHPKFGTPWPAILLIGGLSVLAPLFGRSALVWIVNAGGFGIVIAYLFVAAAFIALRRNEPALARPYRAPGGMATGILAFIFGLALASLYFPWSPAALKWPHEWGLLGVWTLIGFGFWMARPRR